MSYAEIVKQIQIIEKLEEENKSLREENQQLFKQMKEEKNQQMEDDDEEDDEYVNFMNREPRNTNKVYTNKVYINKVSSKSANSQDKEKKRKIRENHRRRNNNAKNIEHIVDDLDAVKVITGALPDQLRNIVDYCRHVTKIVFAPGSQTQTLVGLGNIPFPKGTTLCIPENYDIGDLCFFNNDQGPNRVSSSDLVGNPGVTFVVFYGKKIGKNAFFDCRFLENIVFPHVEKIDDRAFLDCFHLKNINLPDTLRHIGEFAFSGCYSLKRTLTIPRNVSFVGKNAFFCTCVHDLHVTQQLLDSMNMTAKEFGKYVNHGDEGITVTVY